MARQQSDRPGTYSGFGPDGDVGAYAERLVAELTIDQCSAVAAFLCAERRPDESFGTLSDWSDLDALVTLRLEELEELDRELAATILLRDLELRDGRPVFVHAGYVVPLGSGTAERIASELAELAKLSPAGAALAA